MESEKKFHPQRVPSKIGHYLAGFTDGEGSFHVSFRRRQDFKIPWKISLCFNVSQKDPVILSLFKKHLECGTIRERKLDGVHYYEVNNFQAIQTNVIPFFKRFGFLSAKKKKDFSNFQQIAKLIAQKEHLTVEGIHKILKLRSKMNDGGKRKYSDAQIVRILRDYMPNTDSQEADGEDRVRPFWKQEELVRNESVISFEDHSKNGRMRE